MKDLIKPLIVSILTWEAKLALKRHKPFIIGVTGNLGKTSTKDAIYAVLKDHFHVRRSEKSMNSEFGVPLTVLGEKSAWNNPFKWLIVIIRGFFAAIGKEYPTHLVLEIGADRPGDIKSITSWVKPDITVVTQFGKVPVHVEFFKDRDAVVEEKGYLVSALKKSGVYIWNADDHDSKTVLVDKTDARKVSVGIEQSADIKASEISLYGTPPSGTKAKLEIAGEVFELVLPEVVGKSPVYCALPALAVALEFKIPISSALQSLCDADKPKGRMRLLPGMNGSLIIDDTYNASPKAAEHGLKTLASIETAGRKIAVLGDMMELGEHTRDEHYRIGKVAGESAHRLLTVGIRSRATAEGALDAKMNDNNIIQCDNSIEAGKELVAMIEPGDVIYLKGSQSTRMEHAVKMILAETHPAEKYLVRQEEEWLNR